MNKYFNLQKYWNYVKQILSKNYKVSYSQCGEDLIIDTYFHKTKGFYIDVGANDPIKLNNTFFFYKKGWRGINIEPNMVLIKKIRKKRPKDINLNIGCGSKSGSLDFYVINPNTLSTCSLSTAKDYEKQGYKIIYKTKITIKTLKEIIDRYAENTEIDILSIDTEGTDLDVLKGNDWEKFRPKLVVIETLEYKRNGSAKTLNNIYDKYFIEIGYDKLSDTYINTIYVDSKNNNLKKQ